MTTPIVELSEEQRKIKNMALRGFQPDPEDPKASEILAKQKKVRQAELDENLTSLVAGPSSSNELKRKSAPTPKVKLGKRIKKDESTAPLAKEERGQLNELKQKLRDTCTELQLKSAQDRMKRLE